MSLGHSKPRLIAISCGAFMLGVLLTSLHRKHFHSNFDDSHPSSSEFFESSIYHNISQHLVMVESQLTGEEAKELLFYAHAGSSELKQNITHCFGILVAQDAAALPTNCILRRDRLGMIPDRHLKSVETKDSAHAVSRKPLEILGIDTQLDLTYIKIDPIPNTHPVNISTFTRDDHGIKPLFVLSGSFQPLESQTQRNRIKLSYASLIDHSSAAQETKDHIKDQEGRKTVDFVQWNEPSFLAGATFWDANGQFVGITAYSWPDYLERKNSKIINAQGIIAGIRQFVMDRSNKQLKIGYHRMRESGIKRVFDTLGLPFLLKDQVEDKSKNPLVIEVFEKIRAIETSFPVTAGEFDRQVLDKVQDILESAMKNQQHLFVRSWSTLNSPHHLSSTPLDLHQTRLHSNEDGANILPSVTLMSPPVLGQEVPNFIGTYPTQIPSKVPEQKLADMTDQPAEAFHPQGEIFSSEASQSPRYAHLFEESPLVSAAIWPKGKGSSHHVTPRALLQRIIGPLGITIFPKSDFLGLQNQKPLLIQEITNPVEISQVQDGHGRSWQYLGFTLFNNHHFDSWCGAVPDGNLCLTFVSDRLTPVLHAHKRRNIEKYRLPGYLLESSFWSLDTLLSFQADEAWKHDPLFSPFALTRKTGELLELSMPSLGIKFTHPLPQNPHFRLSHALESSTTNSQIEANWKPRGYAVYGLDGNKSPQLCQIHIFSDKDNHVDLQLPQGSLTQKIETKAGPYQIASHCIEMEMLEGSPILLKPKDNIAESAKPFKVSVAKM